MIRYVAFAVVALTFLPARSRAADTLSGTLHASSPVRKLEAVDRAWADPIAVTSGADDAYIYPARVDAKTGGFSIKGLIPGRTYDLIAFTDTGRWEGIDMRYHRPVKATESATDEDRQWLKDFVIKTPSFYDQSRPLYIAADHGHAVILVELQRTQSFHSGSTGEVIHRVELWYFENYFGGWAKDKNTERVLNRFRGPATQLPKLWQYLPAFGGIDFPATGDAKPLNLTLPDKPDPKRGLCP